MSKRHDSLIPLTHDHHHALTQARRLLEASEANAETRRETAEGFVRFYERDTLLHFHEEEEILFPALVEHIDRPPDELVRVLLEHVRIHGLVARLRNELTVAEPTSELLRDLGETLRSHVRLEERRLFPLIE